MNVMANTASCLNDAKADANIYFFVFFYGVFPQILRTAFRKRFFFSFLCLTIKKLIGLKRVLKELFIL
jgi:hypothetical protein